MKKLSILFTILLAGFFSCKKEEIQLHQIRAKQIVLDSTTTENKTITDFIKPFKTHLNNELDATLSNTPSDLTKKDGILESSMGNLMADICYIQGNPIFKNRTKLEVDFVLLNHGGIRSAIPKGNITARNAFEVMPFENEMVVVELTGKKVEELLYYLAINKKAHPISNMTLEIKDSQYYNVIINNEKFDNTKNYFILTSDYLQQGGDRMNFFSDPVKIYKTDYKIRNALIDYFKKTKNITPILDKRFSYAK